MYKKGYNALNVQQVLDAFSSIIFQTIEGINQYVPQILAGILILVIGAAIARALKRGVVKLLETFSVSSAVKNTPIEHFLKNADLTQKIEEVVGIIVYWLVMLVVIQTAVAVLGLDSLSKILDDVLSYIPNIAAAVLVLFFGVLLAGLVESLVKGSLTSIDGKSSRLLGKVSSYLVVSIAIMAAISELGIASEFITILFIGFVSTISLGLGLALGLGGKDVVAKILDDWYQTTIKDLKK